MQINLRHGVVLFGSVVTLFAIACGPSAADVTDPPRQPADAGPVIVTAPAPLQDVDASTKAAVIDVDGGSDAAPAPQCATLARTACVTCCNIAYPDMANAFRSTLAQCVCTSPGECKDDCGGNYCKGEAASAACATCIQGSTTCGPATIKVCEAEPACAAYLGCVDSCPQQ